MKNIFTLLAVLFVGFSNAQIAKYKAIDNNLTSDVTKYETQEFYFDAAQNKYQMCSKKTIYLNKGLVTKIESMMNYFIYVESVNTFNYKNGQLESIETLSSNTTTTEKFIYKNGKIVERIKEGDSNSRSTYEYDKKGNLIKEIERNADDEPSETIFYQDYKNKKSYTKIKKNNDGSESDYTKEIYEDAMLIQSEFVSDNFKSTTKYSYDNYKNVLSQVYNDSSRIDYGYEFDANKNRIKIAKLSQALPEDNSFTFVKITYADGTTSGSTELDLEFIKKHDKLFREKDSLMQQYQKVAYSRKDYLSVLKGEDDRIEIQDSYDNNFEKVVQLIDTPEHSSLIIFNEVDQSVHFVKGFYLDDFAKHEWHDAVKLESPTRIYWVKNNKFKISFYQDGKYLQSSNFSIENDENPNHLVVKSVEGSIYQIQNVDTSEAGRLYPLFKK